MNLVLEEKIKNAIKTFLEERNIELIEFKLFSVGLNYTLRCIIDFPSGGITVRDCAEINQKIFSFLDETKFLGENFNVEVNSPGLGRPLKTFKDFLRVKNRTLCLWLNKPYLEKTYLEGKLIDLDEKSLRLRTKDKVIDIELEKINLGKEKIEI